MRNKTVAILIDGSNLHATITQLGINIDYNKLRNFFGGTLFRAAYFTALPPDGQTTSLRPLVDFLDYNGWTVYQKPTKEFVDAATGERKVKGNMDVEISVVAKEVAPYVTDIVLFSGDGDFRFLVEALQRQHGIHVTVVSSIVTRVPMIADILRRQADTFIDVVDLHANTKREEKDKKFSFSLGGKSA